MTKLALATVVVGAKHLRAATGGRLDICQTIVDKLFKDDDGKPLVSKPRTGPAGQFNTFACPQDRTVRCVQLNITKDPVVNQNYHPQLCAIALGQEQNQYLEEAANMGCCQDLDADA